MRSFSEAARRVFCITSDMFASLSGQARISWLAFDILTLAPPRVALPGPSMGDGIVMELAR